VYTVAEATLTTTVPAETVETARTVTVVAAVTVNTGALPGRYSVLVVVTVLVLTMVTGENET
jgi:hypothetical protein